MTRSTQTFATGSVLLAGYGMIAARADWTQHVAGYWLIYSLLFAGMLLAWRRGPVPLGLLIGGAILFRLVLLPTIPSLSDDIYRYGWEGRVQQAGFSPHKLAPTSPVLLPLRDAAYARINHPSIPTVYPLLSQWAFRVGTALTDGFRGIAPARWAQWDRWVIWTHVLGQKLVFVFFDGLTLWTLWQILKRKGMETQPLVLYAWNPLVITEIQRRAVAAYLACNCEGMTRVDFLMQASTGRLYLNEINTIPGFTSISMYPKMWEHSGVSMPQLVDELIQLALARHERKKATQFTR